MNANIFLLLASLSLSLWSCRSTSNVLQSQQLQYGTKHVPRISGHRGARYYDRIPENSLAAFQLVAGKMPCLLECDVQMTRDSLLVLMHDATIDRTTNGTGRVIDQNRAELKSLYLKDHHGMLTKERIPDLDEVLRWGKGKALLTLDIKRGVPFETVIEAVRKQKAASSVVIITYSVADAQKIYQLAPDLMLSVSIRNQEELQRMLDSGIPSNRMIAFTGTRLAPAALFDQIHQHGILCMVGTLGNLDKKAKAKGEQVYWECLKAGADILATDDPLTANQAVKSF
ncbi:MAG: glycerophosphodiester phosphodiesterase family protein [Bacteroidota bacterium]